MRTFHIIISEKTKGAKNKEDRYYELTAKNVKAAIKMIYNDYKMESKNKAPKPTLTTGD